MTKEPGFFKPLGDSETRYVMSLRREIERLRGKLLDRAWCPDCSKVLEIPNPLAAEIKQLTKGRDAMQSRIEMQAGDAKRLDEFHQSTMDEVKRLKIALVVRQVKVERLEAAAKQYQPLVTACSRWLKEYDHPMPSYFVEAFATAKEQVDG